MTHLHTLVIGIGSDHGDDRLGWRVVELLARVSLPHVSVRALRVPLHLLELDDLYERWIVVDAVCGTIAPGTIYQWEWPNVPTEKYSSRDSHAFSLPDVLRLASELNRLPSCVQVWGVSVNANDCLPQHTGVALTESVEIAATEVGQSILEQISQPAEFARRNSHA